MKKELRELIWDECNKANNFIEIPAIYRHFKGVKDGEDMVYAVSNISVPIDTSDLDVICFDRHLDLLGYDFYHTELEKEIVIYKIEGDNRYYHDVEVEREKLVIYTELYANRDTYVRPLPMFLSPVDKVKYPDAKQKFRLERVI